MNTTIIVPGAIDKDDIKPVHAFAGKVNSQPVVVHGTTYAPLSLRFKCFAGASDSDGRYHGCFQFEAAVGEPHELADFSTIPHFGEEV